MSTRYTTLNTRFPVPTLLCAGYSVKLIKKNLSIKSIIFPHNKHSILNLLLLIYKLTRFRVTKLVSSRTFCYLNTHHRAYSSKTLCSLQCVSYLLSFNSTSLRLLGSMASMNTNYYYEKR